MALHVHSSVLLALSLTIVSAIQVPRSQADDPISDHTREDVLALIASENGNRDDTDTRHIGLLAVGNVSDALPNRGVQLTGKGVHTKIGTATIGPVYYVHIPKSGSSFATTLVHHSCGSNIAGSVTVKEPAIFHRQWGEACPQTKFARFQSGHAPLSRNASIKDVVVMMRHPLQRIMSGYFANPAGLHDCRTLRDKYHCRVPKRRSDGKLVMDEYHHCDGDYEFHSGRVRNTSVIPPLEYAKCVENCASHMLSGNNCSSPEPIDLGLVLRNVNEAGFIGLTEEWALSVCLWHTKFGGNIKPVEFTNVREGVSAQSTGYDIKKYLGDWQPSADMLVYQASVVRFFAEVKKYGLTRESCSRNFGSVSRAFEGSVVFLEN